MEVERKLIMFGGAYIRGNVVEMGAERVAMGEVKGTFFLAASEN